MSEPYQSAFATDEQRRAQQDAERALKRSIEQSTKPPREEGLSSGSARAQLESIAAQDRKARAEIKLEQSSRHLDISGVRRITINPPHKAFVADDELIMEIRTPPAAEPPQSTEANHPFKVSDASAGGVDKVKAYKDSYLYPNQNLATPFSITNLDTAVAVAAGDLVYLVITTDASLAVTDANAGIGAPWTGYDDMHHVDDSDPDPLNWFVDAIYVLIAEIVDDATEEAGDDRDGIVLGGTGTLRLIQHQRNSIELEAGYDVAGVPTYSVKAR